MKNCGNCVYCDLLITEEPCLDCLYSSNWELDKDKEAEEDTKDKISSKEFIKAFGGGEE